MEVMDVEVAPRVSKSVQLTSRVLICMIKTKTFEEIRLFSVRTLFNFDFFLVDKQQVFLHSESVLGAFEMVESMFTSTKNLFE